MGGNSTAVARRGGNKSEKASKLSILGKWVAHETSTLKGGLGRSPKKPRNAGRQVT